MRTIPLRGPPPVLARGGGWTRKWPAAARLLTVGHGTLAQDRFAALLLETGIDLLVDVRAFPGSRRNPQFDQREMARWLPAAGVEYRHEPRLGGRRPPVRDSPHVGLRAPGFRGYAEHMTSEEFQQALQEVLGAARGRTTAVMCAESVWWRCHRKLIADAMVLLHDMEVAHLFHDGRISPHPPSAAARVVATADARGLVYDVEETVRLPEA